MSYLILLIFFWYVLTLLPKQEITSYITPLYNGSKFVKSTIENAKKLNFNVKKYDYEVELVCVNDKPGDILNFKMPHEIIFKLIENHHNLGIQQSRVNGLKESTGDYIIF